MVQRPSWEANWSAASQTPRISRNPQAHYRTHKHPPPVSILGQPNPVHIHTSHLLEIHSNIRPSTPRSPQWLPSLRFPHQDPIRPLSSPIRTTCPDHLILLDFITHTILGEEYKSFSSSLCNLLHSPVTSFLLGPQRILAKHNDSNYALFTYAFFNTTERLKWYETRFINFPARVWDAVRQNLQYFFLFNLFASYLRFYPPLLSYAERCWNTKFVFSISNN